MNGAIIILGTRKVKAKIFPNAPYLSCNILKKTLNKDLIAVVYNNSKYIFRFISIV